MLSREPRPNRLGLLLGVLATVIIVASVAGTLSATRRISSKTAAVQAGGVLSSPPFRIDTAHTANLYCPSSLSFSPDGSRFAVLGTGLPCSEPAAVLPGPDEHKLAIYDMSGDTVQRVIELDRFVATSSLSNCDPAEVKSLQFTSLGWSPDGEHIAVLYAAFDYASYTTATVLSPDDLACSGLLLLSVDADTAVVIDGDAGFFDAATGTYAGYPIWDLDHLTTSPPTTISPSLVYGWSQDGQPTSVVPLSGQPLGQLPTQAGPIYPVGNPGSDSTYTMWQPGIVAGPAVFRGGPITDNDDDVYVTQFPAWIPSSEYVTVLVAGVALSQGAGGNPATTVPTRGGSSVVPQLPLPPDLTQVPARDPALAAVQQQIGANGWEMTGWNQRGSMLASIDCQRGAGANLDLRDTQTGDIIGSRSLGLAASDPGCSIYDLSPALGDYPNPNLDLRWAPDGRHLLLSDQTASAVTIWQVDSSEDN